MSWSEHAIWWHVYPLGFTGAGIRPGEGDWAPGPRLRRLESWLDYLVELGCNGLLLGPVFASGSHGYDTIDHFRIDPRLGDDADFDHLIAECHSRGIKLVLDGVFNHVGRGHPAFQGLGPSRPRQLADARGRAPQGNGMEDTDTPGQTPHKNGMGDTDTPGQTPHKNGMGDTDTPGQTPHENGMGDTDTTGNGVGDPAQLFRIDPSTGSVANFEGHDSLVALDHHSPAVADLVADVMLHWCRRGVDGWRLDAAYAVPSEFWADVLPRVRAEFPDVWVVGEVIHGDYAEIVRASGMDTLTQYELWKAVWSSLLDENFHELSWTLGRHNEFLETFTPATFVGNHDVTRIATLLPRAKAALAHLILFTVGGIPSLYYGDEQGYTGTKTERIGGDDEVRPPFPDSPDQLSTLGAPVHQLVSDLIGIRRRNPWLTTARTEVTAVANAHLTYDAVGREGQRLTVELALGAAPIGRILIEGRTLLETTV